VEEVEFDVSEVHDSLKELGIRARNQRVVNEQISEIMLAMVEEKFDSEGPGWAPLEASTIKRRRGGRRILQDSGHLAASVTASAGTDFALVFTNVEYAKFHLEGTSRMPARDFFDIDMEEVYQQAEDIILESITR
jgi:phage gpG-like protein